MIHKVKVDRTGRNVKSTDTGRRRKGQGLDLPDGQQMVRLQVNRKTLGCEALHEASEKGWDGSLVKDADAKDVDEQRGRGRWLNT